MPLPDDFDAYQHLLEQIKVQHNLQVERSFIGVKANDISTGVGNLRTACFITDDDNLEMIQLRLFLYHFKLRLDLPQDIYGLPSALFQETVVHKPQIRLLFRENYTLQLASEKLAASEAEIKIRIMNMTDTNINQSMLFTYAERIKTLFGEGEGFSWEKGKTQVVYRDDAHGYNMRLYTSNQEQGEVIIQKVLEIQEHPFNSTFIRASYINNQYPTGTYQVLGHTMRHPRKYPTATVRFRRAEFYASTLEKPVMLVDLTGRHVALA